MASPAWRGQGSEEMAAAPCPQLCASQCTVCVTPTPGSVCAGVCPQWPPPAVCQPAEGRAERLLSFGSESVGEGRGRDAGDCLLTTPATEHPPPPGSPFGQPKWGPDCGRCPSFCPPESPRTLEPAAFPPHLPSPQAVGEGDVRRPDRQVA